MTTASPPVPPAVEQPAPDAGPTVRPELRRSGTDRMLGGVSGGLAEYSGIDVVLWRVGFVALTLLGGSGFLVYLLLWVLMPPGTAEPQNALDGLVDRLRTALTGSRRPMPRG